MVFVVGYLREAIESYIADAYPNITAHYVVQAIQDGTAGAVSLAEPFVDEDVLILFVDTLFDADLGLVRDVAETTGGVIWAKEVEDYQQYGVILTDEEGHMVRIIEKPSEPISKLANIGLYYIRDWQLLFEGIHHTLGAGPGPSGEFYLTDAFQYMVDHGSKIQVAPVARLVRLWEAGDTCRDQSALATRGAKRNRGLRDPAGFNGERSSSCGGGRRGAQLGSRTERDG